MSNVNSDILLVSHTVLYVRELVIFGHSECGFYLTFGAAYDA